MWELVDDPLYMWVCIENNFWESLTNAKSRESLPNDEEFRAALLNRHFYHDKGRGFCMFLLHSVNQAMHGFCQQEAKNPFESEIHIEHIMPENKDRWVSPLKNGHYDISEYDDMCQRIGNLTILGGVPNTRIKDAPFTEKYQCYVNSAYDITKDLAKYKTGSTVTDEDWNYDTIMKRSQDLADKMLVLWPSDETKIK